MVCPKCGRVLVEGEICVCSQNDILKREYELQMERQAQIEEEERIQAEKEAAAAERRERTSKALNNAKNLTADISGNLIQHILGILKNPINGIKEFCEEKNMINALILIAAQSIFFGIFAAAMVSSSLSMLLGGFAGLLGISFGKKFLIWLLVSIVAAGSSCTCAAAFMLISKMQKNSIDFIDSLCLTSPKAVIITPLTIITLIASAINGSVGLACFILTLFASVCMDATAFRLINREYEKEPYYLIGIEAMTTVVTFILLSITLNIIF